jgi:hypothetical protein
LSWSFIRREWGAVTFLLTVLIGIVAVPLALEIGNRSSAPAAPVPRPAASAPASPSPHGPSPSPTT